ncbi:MAG: HNH endonuclease [Firmicutes bacterium]|nr:HNH endonuclease [Bacillota bacterium]
MSRGWFSAEGTKMKQEHFAPIDTWEEQCCEIDGARPAEAHHIRTRGAGGSDDPENVMWLCRRHHREIHSMGRDAFFTQYLGRLRGERIRYWWRLRRGEAE